MYSFKANARSNVDEESNISLFDLVWCPPVRLSTENTDEYLNMQMYTSKRFYCIQRRCHFGLENGPIPTSPVCREERALDTGTVQEATLRRKGL